MTAPDMDMSADAYYDSTALMDIRVVSTLGLTDKDVDALSDIEGVEKVDPELETDVLVELNSEQYVMRMHSLPYNVVSDSGSQSDVSENPGSKGIHPLSERFEDVEEDEVLQSQIEGNSGLEDGFSGESAEEPESDTDTDTDAGTDSDSDIDIEIEDFSAVDTFPTIKTEQEAEDAALADNVMNRLTLVEGRFPTASNECVISADNVMNSPVSVGDTIYVQDGVLDVDDTLTCRQYKVVGFAHSPYYVSTGSMGYTSIGSGTIDQFMYVPANDFQEGIPFTEAFIQVDGASDELSGSQEYQAKVDAVLEAIELIAPECEERRLADIKNAAQVKLDEARGEYYETRAEAEQLLKDARAKLDEAAADITSGRSSIASGQSEYNSGLQEYEDSRIQAQEQFALAQAEIDSKWAELDSSKAQLDAAAAQLKEGWEQAGSTPDAAPAQIEQLKQALPSIPPGTEQYAQVAAAIEALERLSASQKEYDSGISQYKSGAMQIQAAQAELDAKQQEVVQQFDEARQKLDSALAELASARRKLQNGITEYNSGTAEYAEEEAKAQDEFADAEEKLADAQRRIDEIEAPTWLVMDRTKNPGTVNFEADADRVNNIASFFPFIFFLVAALVALTTMTRMVEEERPLIGTFKALGYSRGRITSKYLIYAACASVLGSVVGIAVLSLILPPVIMEAYAIIYSVPHPLLMPIDIPIALFSMLLGVGITLVATWAAAASTLREVPAELMRPRAPKEGKRILLERIGPLWKRMSFSWKVTFRNIFRYKKRLVMTVIGIAGCTGLLLTGLGLQDSVNDIIDKQYGQTVFYNVQVSGDDSFTDSTYSEIADFMDNSAQADVSAMMASGPGKSDVSVSVICPEDPGSFNELWILRDRATGQPVPFGNNSVVITEKLGNMLGIGVGDTITLSVQDDMGNSTDESYGFTVDGVIENYISNYVMVGSDVYGKVFGEAPEYRDVFGVVGASSEEHQAFRDAVSILDGVKTISFNDEVIDAYRKMLRSVNMIVVVLVVAAGALAFIVLYNLTNINITERQREIATLKVLGFTPHEVDMYIFRETAILTVLGALIGLLFGVFLEGFVIVSAEVDYVMFGRDIHVASFIVAFVVTLVFAAVVMLAMRRKLLRIDMVESLKSIE